jgi:hypothetical protein
MLYAIKLLETLSEQTWDRIRDGAELDISQGEETITDFNLLEIKRSRISTIRVVKLSKDEEAINGIDWEWWIGSAAQGWLRYAVQAKKIHLASQRYDGLGHKANGIPQWKLLEAYSGKNSAIPLYCFYNYSKNVDPNRHWQCGFPYEAKQFGCTVTPLSVVKQAMKTRGRRNFEFIHTKHDTIPWRCLLKCPRVLQIYLGLPAGISFENAMVYPALPANLESALREDQSIPVSQLYPRIQVDEFDDLDAIDIAYFADRPEIRIIPRRVLIIDIGSDAE